MRGAHDAAGATRRCRACWQDRAPAHAARPRRAWRRRCRRRRQRHRRLLPAQHRRAAEGVERRQRGMADHRIGLGDEAGVRRRGPRQRIERQAVADRRIAGDQVALLAAQEPRPAASSGRGRCARARSAARCRPASRVPSRTRGARRSRSIGSRGLAGIDLDVARQPPLAPQVVPGVLERLEQVAGIELQPLGEGLREAVGDLGRGAGRLGSRARSAPDRARSARRPCASSSRAPSAAAARRDTTCPGRNAATAPCANRCGELAEQHAGQPPLLGPSASVFHSAPSMSSIDTKVGSPPMVSLQPGLRDVALDRLADAEQRLPLRPRCRAWWCAASRAPASPSCRGRTRPRSSSTAPSIGAALDGSGVQASGMWPSPVEQARGRVEADPARARQVDLAPGMEVGEVVPRALGSFERLLVRRELDQVARGEARGEAEMAQDGAPAASRCRGTSPWRAPASARSVCTPGSRRIDVADLLLQPRIEADEEIDGALRRCARPWRATLASSGPARLELAERRDLLGERGIVGERPVLGLGSRKKSNGLITAMSATRSTVTSNFVVFSGKTSRAR